jgi:hypothetical protein
MKRSDICHAQFLLRYSFSSSSVLDPWDFGTDPDPRIHSLNLWIRLWIRIRLETVRYQYGLGLT